MADAALFDVDGTLIDTNYHHALAWSRAFHEHGIHPPLWRIHRAIGMGGDQLIAAVTDEQVEDRYGDKLRRHWAVHYEPLLSEVQPFDAARLLLEKVKQRGFTIVLASSAPQKHLEHYLDLLDAHDLIEHATTSDDVEQTKPEPDLVAAAMRAANTESAVMIGDSTWDAIAADKLQVPTIAVRTGGFSEQELRDAGAVSVYDCLRDLVDDLDNTPLAAAHR